MSQIETFETLLWVALCLWIVAFMVAGLPMLQALHRLTSKHERPSRALLEGMVMLGALGAFEVIALLVRLQSLPTGPRWITEAAIYSIALAFAFQAVVFIVTGYRVRR